MNKNVKIAKELMKIAELLINKTNEDEMFEKLYDKNLDVNHRQEIINYFMKTREGLETLCFDDFDVLYDNEREMVLKAASNNEDFDDYCFVTMLKTKQYKNNNEKNIMLNAIINDEYCMDLICDIIDMDILSFYEEIDLIKIMMNKTENYDELAHKLANIKDNEKIIKMLMLMNH
jgi:hypothetical protein